MEETAKETVNEQLEIPVVTDSQKKRIQFLCSKVNRNEITKNEAFRYSQAEGETEDEVFKGTYKDFMSVATSNGWLNITNGEIDPSKPFEKPEAKIEKTNYVLPICIGIGAAIILIYAIKKFSKTESK